MVKFDLSKLLKIGLGVGKVAAPGAIGSIFDVVSENIDDHNDPKNEQSLREMAATIDAQNQAILALHARLKKLEGRE